MEPEEAAPQETAQEQQSKESFPNEVPTEKDSFLQDLVFQSNMNPKNYLPITLQIRGLLVSGTMISGDEYFQLIADITSAAGSNFYEYITSFGVGYKEGRDDNTISEDPMYIHLKDCAFSSAMGHLNLKSVWRGRISTVDGFFMGSLDRKD